MTEIELEEEEIAAKTPRWKGILIIAFTVVAVSGMMYMLFTDDEYNKYGSGGSSTAVTASASGTKTDSTNEPKTETDPKAVSSTSAKETAPVATSTAVPAPKPVQETKPPVTTVKPQAVSHPVSTPKVEPKPQPEVVAKPAKLANTYAAVSSKPMKSQPAVVAKPQPVAAAKPANVAANYSAVSAKPAKAVKALPAPKPVAKNDKVMSDGELQELASNLMSQGKAAGVYPKCVQLRNTADGNNKSTIRQIESFLRGQSFTIAGRQTVSAQVKGLQITPGEGCMKLTVGSF